MLGASRLSSLSRDSTQTLNEYVYTEEKHNVTFDINKSSNKLLIILALTDLVFILLHILYRKDLATRPLFSIAKDSGYAEIYQYIKEYWVVLLLSMMAIKKTQIIYITWSTLFMYLLLDDSLRIHERLGNYLANNFELQPTLNIRPQDFGELGISILFGSLIFIFIGWAYLFSDSIAKQISKRLFILVLSLAFFGILVDILNIAIPWGKPILWTLVEDGGEMIIMSIILWYVFDLKYTPK